MHIIITDAWLAKSQALHLNGAKLLGAALLASALTMLGAVAAYHWVFLEGVRQGWPGFAPVARLVSQGEVDSKNLYMRENLDAMARKLGEMQARMMQIDSLGDRVAGLAGLKPEDFKSVPLGSGGVLVDGQPLSVTQLQVAMGSMDQQTSSRVDWLTAVESRLFDQKMTRSLVPTQEPVEGGRIGSPFGYRIDPLNGQKALHTGLDFASETGTPIYSAAGGVVIVQEMNSGYGNMVEIDHGNNIVTRYAHASKVFVNKGDIVKRGQKIAEVGSTGRSTGPHLHFEVWVSGVAQDPRPFLDSGKNLALAEAGKTRKP